jgi:Tfp pilus assembly protein PilP
VKNPTGRHLLAALLMLLNLTPLCLYSAEKTPPQAPPKPEEFSYTSQDRRDPFESVYEAKNQKTMASQNKQQKEGYELEELKLVGVIKTGDVKFAMMEDAQGRGMLFKKGDFFNKSMWLLDILEDKIILAHRLRGDIRKIPMDIPRK